jgi:tetratricopeptide (TPR) repeat protein
MVKSGRSSLLSRLFSGFSLKTKNPPADKKWSREFRKLDRLLKDKDIRGIESLLNPLHKWLKEEAAGDAVHPEWLNQAGLIYQAYLGDFIQAEECFRSALLKAGEKGNVHEKALAMTNLGVLFLDQSRSGEAVEIFTELKPFIGENFGSESPETATTCQNLAAAYRQAGNEENAKSERVESTRILRKITEA